MKAEVTQHNGLKLSIDSANTSGEIIVVLLTGTNFLAQVTVGNEPSHSELGSLADFLRESAFLQTGSCSEWRSACEDLAFTVSAEPEFLGSILLRVYMGSNSDDDCDWQVDVSLLLSPEQLRSFANTVPVPLG
jgi:hypothetical protein